MELRWWLCVAYSCRFVESAEHRIDTSEWIGTSEVRFAKSFGCPADDKLVDEALMPWWDIRFTSKLVHSLCKLDRQTESAYQIRVANKRVFFARCPGRKKAKKEPVSDTLQMLLDVVLALARVPGGVPDVVFTVADSAMPFTSRVYWTAAPIFHWSVPQAHWAIPLPTPVHFRAYLDNNLGDNPNVTVQHLPWSDRDGKLFWRGSLTFPDVAPSGTAAALPRARLLRLAEARPELFDVGVTEMDVRESKRSELNPTWQKHMTAKLSDERVKSEPSRFKFVLGIEGGADGGYLMSSWSAATLMSTGAVVLLQDGTDTDIIHMRLQPWVHYVPVRNDLSDLVATVEHLRANDNLARRIAEAGLAFFQLNVTRSHLVCYLWRLLRVVANHSDPNITLAEKRADAISEAGVSTSQAFLDQQIRYSITE
eukprot:TRINITY_DN75075_c0_g1_i1.p1 TRINITY_DN75075_c0_g1~~TRINITY_DN75075_c0_g1_i1.p1  ORF type:complete len:424 (+),score=65.56 TRINITY_DN75075_c0_g1_i1:167-1438(+)